MFNFKKLQVTNRKTGYKFEVEHFHITNWPDHSVLNPRYLKKFVKFLDLLSTKKNVTSFPYTFHCSAGVGRSGTLAAAFFLYRHFINTKRNLRIKFKFSIFELVRNLREQRYKAVQKMCQYKFLYELVLHLIKIHPE